MYFLEHVVPQDGHICLAVHDGRRMRHHFFSSAEEAGNALWKVAGNFDTYFAFASFKTPTKRRRTNIQSIRAFVFDVDTGKDGGYPDKRSAIAAIRSLIEARRLLPPSIIIDSGGGYHLYWLLEEPVSVEEWVPRARAFKRHLVAIDPVLAVDTVRVTDPAGLLRVPGTINTKHQRVVEVIRDDYERTYSLNDFPAATEAAPVVASEAPPPSIGLPEYAVKPKRSPDELYADDTTRVPAKHLFAACRQFVDAYEKQETEKYPAWWLTVQLCAFTQEGERLAHFMSSRYPKYSYEEVAKKYAQAEASRDSGVGPVTCEAYANERGSLACEGCSFRNAAKSPIVAATQAQMAEAAKIRKTEVIKKASNPAAQDRPAETQGSAEGVTAAPVPQVPNAVEMVAQQGALVDAVFEFDPETGAVLANLQSGKSIIPVIATPRAMTVLGRVDGDEPVALIGLYNKPGTKIIKTKPVPAASLSTVQSLHRLYTSFGFAVPAGSDLAQRAFRLYASALTMQFNTNAQYYKGASRMGWTKDGFIIANEEFTAKGPRRVEPTEELERIARLFRTKGKREWQYEALDGMLQLLAPEMQLALLAALASPLMKFTGESGLFVHLEGPSGCGKSTLLRIASGLYGKPTSTHFTPNDTRASREARLYLYRHLPALFDEITPLLADGESLHSFIYAITNGEGYHRARRDGSLQRPKSGWNLIALTTANISMTSRISSGNHTNMDEALLLRILEVKIKKNRPIADLGKAQHLLTVLENNYGWVGRDFISHVMKHKKAVQEKVKALVDRYNLEYTQQYRFINAGLACVQVALEILHELGITGVPMNLLQTIGDKLRGGVEQQREQLKEAKSPMAAFTRLVHHIRNGLAVFTSADKRRFDMGEVVDGFVLQARPRGTPVARLLLAPNGARLFVSAVEFKRFSDTISGSTVPEMVELFEGAGMLKRGPGPMGETNFDLARGIPDMSGNVPTATLAEPCFELIPPAAFLQGQ